MSDSVRPHRRQPTRLPCPWDSPSKNTGVGCHFLLQCMKVKSESEVAQSCSTLSHPMDCSLPGSSTHGILQARVLKWGAIAFSNQVPTRYLKHYETLITWSLFQSIPQPPLSAWKNYYSHFKNYLSFQRWLDCPGSSSKELTELGFEFMPQEFPA